MGFDGTDLSPDEFRKSFAKAVVGHCHGAWTLFGPTKRGNIPVGIVLGTWGPLEKYMTVVGIAWMPWATKRNIIEGTVGFFNEIRKEISFLGFATEAHKKLYVICCRHGIMRRVGTTFIFGPTMAVFETLEPKRHVISEQPIRRRIEADPIHA